jgi:uncharacterized membrane protein
MSIRTTGRAVSRSGRLLRGPAGHPLHPPLTDVVIGALTIGTAAAVLGWVGLAEEAAADAAFIGVVGGLIAAVPTAIAGLADYLIIPRGTPLRRAAAIHWVVNVWGLALFTVAAVLLEPGPGDGRASASGAIVAVLAWLVLLVGGYVGGTMVFTYGMRVVGDADRPTAEALRPTRGSREGRRPRTLNGRSPT